MYSLSVRLVDRRYGVPVYRVEWKRYVDRTEDLKKVKIQAEIKF
jgi:hypothetical protein